MNKTIKHILLLICFLGAACKADETGFLNMENARYSVEVMTFKAKLDPDDPDDARRIKFHTPYSTSKIEGVDASSAPVFSIEQINSENGNTSIALEQFYINKGSGNLYLDWDHTVPVGEYIFSIGARNENDANFEIAEDLIMIIIE